MMMVMTVVYKCGATSGLGRTCSMYIKAKIKSCIYIYIYLNKYIYIYIIWYRRW